MTELELAGQLREMQETLSEQIGDLRQAVGGLTGSINAEVGAIKDRHDRFREELLSEGGRVFEIEAELKRAEARQWIHSALILPAVGIIHAVVRKMGWPV